MVLIPLSRLQPSRDEAIKVLPCLDRDVLRSSRSRQVCLSCHFFPTSPGSQLHPTAHLLPAPRLIAHGKHLTHRCSGWTEDLHCHRGWVH